MRRNVLRWTLMAAEVVAIVGGLSWAFQPGMTFADALRPKAAVDGSAALVGERMRRRHTRMKRFNPATRVYSGPRPPPLGPEAPSSDGSPLPPCCKK